MLVTPSNINFYFTGLETRFWTAYGIEPIAYTKLSTVYPVATEQWVSGWIGMLDKMREWIGPRITNTPAPQTYLVPIQNFELTEGIDLFKLEDDTYGIYNPVVAFMGMQAAKWPDYQFRDMLQNQSSQTGARQLGIDNLTFFNTAHPVDFWDASKGTFCNDYTGGGVSVNGILIGGALASNAFATVWEDMATRKTESGESWGLQPDLAFNGPKLKHAMSTILQAQFIGLPVIGSIGTQVTQTAGSTALPNSPLIGASENMVKGWSDQLTWSDLGGSATVGGGTYDQVWYLAATTRPVRALSWLLRQAPDFIVRNRPDDPVVFDTHTIQYGSKARGAPAWGFAQLMSRSGA
jgi:phage major head subunit gpT-like protein